MKERIILLTVLFIFTQIVSVQTIKAQASIECYKVKAGEKVNVKIENGQLYRLTIKSCWYSAYAEVGTYLIYGLNVADPKTNGKPEVLKVEETTSIDWIFSFSLSGQYDANMEIKSLGWGDQGLLVVIERLKCS